MQMFYVVSLYLFLLSIIIFRLPNIYIIPFTTSGIFTSQAIARLILGMLFFTNFILFYKQKNVYTKDMYFTILLVLLFFLLCSLSVFSAQNLTAFLSIYKDFVIGILSFFVFMAFRKEKVKIAIVLLITIPVNIVYQAALLYGKSFFTFLQTIIYEKHFDLVYYNLQRHRIYTDVYDEAFLPLLILLLNKKRQVQSVLLVAAIGLLSCLAFLSNFRTRIVMLILGIFTSFIFLQKITVKKILYLCLFLGVVAILVSSVSYATFGFAFYDRFLLFDEIDIQTVFSRFIQIQNGLEMGLVSPFGVGMGNYYDALTRGKSMYDTFSPLQMQSSANQYIHNNLVTVIAESGYIAFVVFVVLLGKFAAMDIKTLQGTDKYKKAFVISFWLLFFFGLLNPPIPGSYQVLFWGLRGLLM